MCDFLSAIVFQDGKIFCAPEHTDSHTDLIAAKGLRDDDLHLRNWIRVEFTPNGFSKNSLADVDGYKLEVDEMGSAPDWFDNAAKFNVEEELRDKVRAMIVNDEREILLGGVWILTEGARVKHALNAYIKAMTGNSHVSRVSGRSLIDSMHDFSSVGTLCGYSHVRCMSDDSRINEMAFMASVDSIFERCKIDINYGRGKVWYDHRQPTAEQVEKAIADVAARSSCGSVCNSLPSGVELTIGSVDGATCHRDPILRVADDAWATFTPEVVEAVPQTD